MIDILIPTYGRADRLARVADNVHAATEVEHRLIFVIEPDDHDSFGAVGTYNAHASARASLVDNQRTRSYAGAINTGYHATDGEWLFAGADDLEFTPGWDHAALALDDGWAGVIGTNDLINPYVVVGSHATHYLVRRAYLDGIGGVADEGPGSFLCERYDHQFTDTEFIATAKMRARFRPCLDSIVRHLHWSVNLGPRDATADKAYVNLERDAELYDERRDLWFNLSR